MCWILQPLYDHNGSVLVGKLTGRQTYLSRKNCLTNEASWVIRWHRQDAVRKLTMLDTERAKEGQDTRCFKGRMTVTGLKEEQRRRL